MQLRAGGRTYELTRPWLMGVVNANDDSFSDAGRYSGLDAKVERARELLEAGADQVLLDNMTTDDMAEAVRIADGRATLEASGGLTVERALEVAQTGVDYLAIGALTHSASVLDIAMDLRSAD